MVSCSIPCCTSNFRQNYKDRKMVFFNVPPKPKPIVYRGKDKAYRNAINNIKRCQYEAWIHVINKGCKEGEC